VIFGIFSSAILLGESFRMVKGSEGDGNLKARNQFLSAWVAGGRTSAPVATVVVDCQVITDALIVAAHIFPTVFFQLAM
jgi:hypothetical protein